MPLSSQQQKKLHSLLDSAVSSLDEATLIIESLEDSELEDETMIQIYQDLDVANENIIDSRKALKKHLKK